MSLYCGATIIVHDDGACGVSRRHHEAHPQVEGLLPQLVLLLGGTVEARMALDLEVERARLLETTPEVQGPHSVFPHHLKVARVISAHDLVLNVMLKNIARCSKNVAIVFAAILYCN